MMEPFDKCVGCDKPSERGEGKYCARCSEEVVALRKGDSTIREVTAKKIEEWKAENERRNDEAAGLEHSEIPPWYDAEKGNTDMDESYHIRTSTGDTMSKPNKAGGIKHDQGKTQWTVLPFKAIDAIAQVLMFGSKKYDRDNWKKVEGERYLDAAFRHLTAWNNGEVDDQDSGMSHLWHAGASVVFAIQHEIMGNLVPYVNRIEPEIDLAEEWEKRFGDKAEATSITISGDEVEVADDWDDYEFKTGDEVRITDKNGTGDWCEWMTARNGEIGEVTAVETQDSIEVRFGDGDSWWYMSKHLDLILIPAKNT